MLKAIRMLGLTALFTVTALLTGCAAIPWHSSELERPFDKLEVGWVDRAQGSVWLRTGLYNPRSPLAAALQRACAAGKSVEILAWEGYASTLEGLKGSCIRVYVTNHPQVSKYPDTLLIDSDQLVIYGALSDFQGARARGEYEAQAFVKANQARRIN